MFYEALYAYLVFLSEGPFKIVLKLVDFPNYYLRVHSEVAKVKKQECSHVPNDLSHKCSRSKDSTAKKEEEDSEEDLELMDGAVLLTTEEANASCFFLIPVDEDDDDEFYIVYYHEEMNVKGGRYVPPKSKKSLPYYLYAKSSLFGWKTKDSLQFAANPGNNCKFRFQRSVTFNSSSESSLIKDAQEEPIYIRCPRHWSRTSYVYMFMSESPTLGCTHSIDAHEETSHYFLFNLIHVKPPSEETDDWDENPLSDLPTISVHLGQ